tara:strand:- start:399 stop:608 length:210 start_codon:yes stop_codon:yes gene_type:complete
MMKNKLYRWADQLDIWITKKFNVRPKQRYLEIEMDLYEDPRMKDAMDQALGIETEKTKKNEQRNKKIKK